MADNGISTLGTKQARQVAKLELAQTKRLAQGDARPYYDLTQLPTQYDDNTVVDNENAGGLVVGRPWVTTAPGPDIITAGLVLHLDAGDTDSYPGTGTTWYDLSPSGKNATLGNAVYYIPADGGQLTFSGGSNGIGTISSAQVMSDLTNNMTIEAWYNNNSQLTPRILATGSGSNGFCFGAFSSTSTKWKVTKYAGGSDLFVGSVPQDTNTWHQVVLVYSSTAGTKIYIDGVLSETNASTGNLVASSTDVVTIGAVESLYHKGNIGIIRWYNTVLSDADILQNYNANIGRYKNPVTSNLLIYYDPYNRNTKTTTDLLRTLTNASYTAVVTNATWAGNTSVGSPYLTYNGTSAFANLADGGTYEPGTGDYTVEAWVNATTLAGSSRVILGKFAAGGAAQHVSYALRTLETGATRFEVGNGTTTVSTPSYTISTDTWYQVVGVWTNVASNSIELYINGVSQGSNSHAFASVLNASTSLYLGAYNGGEYAQYWDGKIGVTRIYNKALSSAEVLQNFENDRGLYGI